MTPVTRDLVLQFERTMDVNLVPGIIIGMQEEDNVSSEAPFGGCMRQLRNISAHAPYILTSYLQNPVFKNFDTHTITSGTACCYLCIYHFLAVMYHMYVTTEDVHYIKFANSFIKLMMPDHYHSARMFDLSRVTSPDPSRYHITLVSLQQNAFLNNKRVRHYNPNDTKLEEIRDSNPKLFWKIVLPDISEFVLSALPESGNVLNMSVYKFVIEILRLRDCCQKREEV